LADEEKESSLKTELPCYGSGGEEGLSSSPTKSWLLIASQDGNFKGKWWMPWEIEAMKDVAWLR
jgi:hypothetical protein